MLLKSLVIGLGMFFACANITTTCEAGPLIKKTLCSRKQSEIPKDIRMNGEFLCKSCNHPIVEHKN